MAVLGWYVGDSSNRPEAEIRKIGFRAHEPTFGRNVPGKMTAHFPLQIDSSHLVRLVAMYPMPSMYGLEIQLDFQ